MAYFFKCFGKPGQLAKGFRPLLAVPQTWLHLGVFIHSECPVQAFSLICFLLKSNGIISLVPGVRDTCQQLGYPSGERHTLVKSHLVVGADTTPGRGVQDQDLRTSGPQDLR